MVYTVLQVKNPFATVMLSRHYSAEGRFTFTSHDSGEHTICIGTNTTRWFGGNKLVGGRGFSVCNFTPLSPHTHIHMHSLIHTHTLSLSLSLIQRVHLDIQIGEQAVNYPEVAAREKLGELQLRIRQLLDQIEQISKEQVYQRVRQSTLYTTLFVHYHTQILSCVAT